MKGIIVLLLLALIAAVTNPSEESHRQYLHKACMSEAPDSTMQTIKCKALLGLAAGVGAIKYVDYSLASVTMGPEEKLVSVGIFGLVFPAN